MRLDDHADLEFVDRVRCLHYEGDTTTGRARVNKATVNRAKGGLAKSRAKTVRGKQKAVNRAGAADRSGKLFKTQPAKELTASELRNRTKVRAAKRAGATPGAGRVQTKIKVNQVRKSQRRARLRKSFGG